MYKVDFPLFSWPDWYEDYECDGKMGIIIEIGARPEVTTFPKRADEAIDFEVYL